MPNPNDKNTDDILKEVLTQDQELWLEHYDSYFEKLDDLDCLHLKCAGSNACLRRIIFQLAKQVHDLKVENEKLKGKGFPVLQSSFEKIISWNFLKTFEGQIEKNHYQTLTQLAERGGLSWNEIHHAMVHNDTFQNLEENIAHELVQDQMLIWFKEQLDES